MIVRRMGDELRLVAQPDHARVSGTFASHWGNDRFERARPFVTAVRAATHHDDGWLRYEVAPLLDESSGLPCTFRGLPEYSSKQADQRWAIDWMTSIDPYAGLLLKMHRAGLPKGRFGLVRGTAEDSRSGRRLPRDILEVGAEESIRHIAEELGSREVWINYRLLQVWDLLSLYLCEQEPCRAVIGPAPVAYRDQGPGEDLSLVPNDGGVVRVTPFPFDRDPMVVSLRTRRLPAVPFASQDAFLDAYLSADDHMVEFRFTA